MTAAQEKLIADNIRLAPYCANRFAPFFAMIDDAERVSIGYKGLMEAAKSFDPAKGAFTTYAAHTIHLRLMSAKTAFSAQKRQGVLVELDCARRAYEPCDVDLQLDVRQALKDAMHGANELDKKCFLLHFWHGYPYREIGEMFGFSGQRARERAGRIAARFRMFWELSHRGEV